MVVTVGEGASASGGEEAKDATHPAVLHRERHGPRCPDGLVERRDERRRKEVAGS